MIFASILLVLVLILSAYLNSGVHFIPVGVVQKEGNQPLNNSDLSPIRFLTANTTRVVKNYENPPIQLGTSLYNISTKINQSSVTLYYQFPLIGRDKSLLTITIDPKQVSSIVDNFGVESNIIKKGQEGIKFQFPSDPSEFIKVLEDFRKGSLLVDEIGNMELNYPELVNDSYEFSKPIALHILNELTRINKDGYFERIQATLNFVQFIPYGQPDFDCQNFYYIGLALPPESLVLNYSDCDSKSVLFASILSHLIDHKNIILVVCDVSEGTGELEHHMMVGVKGLDITEGQKVDYNNEIFQLLETTNPCSIGSWHWNTFHLRNIIELNNPTN